MKRRCGLLAYPRHMALRVPAVSRGAAITWTATDVRASLKPWRTFKHVERVNLAKEKLERLQAGPQGVSLAVRGHKIVTRLFSD